MAASAPKGDITQPESAAHARARTTAAPCGPRPRRSPYAAALLITTARAAAQGHKRVCGSSRRLASGSRDPVMESGRARRPRNRAAPKLNCRRRISPPAGRDRVAGAAAARHAAQRAGRTLCGGRGAQERPVPGPGPQPAVPPLPRLAGGIRRPRGGAGRGGSRQPRARAHPPQPAAAAPQRVAAGPGRPAGLGQARRHVPLHRRRRVHL
ncbi:MAG: hypothetical protein J3K34DRAFT_433812 [Monoraphidium minutum]|nr:MAG: hypothetical protein J3K34DRAFT_433812 [Monoraphidium minutum]